MSQAAEGAQGSELLTVREVAEVLRLKPDTLYRWAREGRLPAIKVGKEWRVRPDDIERILGGDPEPARNGGVVEELPVRPSPAEELQTAPDPGNGAAAPNALGVPSTHTGRYAWYPIDMAESISLDAARQIVAGGTARLPGELVALQAALGRTLAEEVTAAIDVQPFDNSAMDGFAIVAGSGERLRIAGESRAGAPASSPVSPGEAFRISTGAPIPAGADAVLRVEDSEVERGNGDEWVRLLARPERGANIRRAGEDMVAGDVVLKPGSRLGAAELAACAVAGRAEVVCTRRPVIGVVVTGDELVTPGEPLAPGQIHDSNTYAVRALLEQSGAEAGGVERCPDDAEATRAAVGRALDGTDGAIVCGGISVGEHDHVKEAFAAHGVEQAFWGVSLKPGRPTWFGRSRGRPVFGLPGNPVSAIVTFELLVRPALERLLGATAANAEVEAVLTENYRKRPGRTEAVRCRLEASAEGWLATPTGAQGSHVLTSMIDADAYALLPEAATEVPAGERVRILLR